MYRINEIDYILHKIPKKDQWTVWFEDPDPDILEEWFEQWKEEYGAIYPEIKDLDWHEAHDFKRPGIEPFGKYIESMEKFATENNLDDLDFELEELLKDPELRRVYAISKKWGIFQ